MYVYGELEIKAGTSQIGSVDVTSLPALPAGTNNIGDVDLASVPVVGAHGNAWNAAAVLANGTSPGIDCQFTANVTAFGSVDAATDISVEVSQNGVNWYNSFLKAVLAGAGHFYISVPNLGARHVRLSSSAAATITATIAGKG
ncbi:hypothetical protein [Paenibacillus prosopidis]|uniref:Uncharacterized protein n=1 Tax=Paenibacillus prosopidis TaxID=630520 RepID=A0A368VXE3_9BACL|nr:hypothetical protein [Paenibacillus prosopidis]RCW44222.1 hypothetical protein DFP97_11286 [Paenibacillus prosopidis]